MPWIDANDVYTWPPKSPDFHSIENFWGMLARAVYHNQRQYTSIQDLEETIVLKRSPHTEVSYLATVHSVHVDKVSTWVERVRTDGL